MEKEYLFYLYISWEKEKVVVISHNSKMSKDLKKKKTRMENAHLWIQYEGAELEDRLSWREGRLSLKYRQPLNNVGEGYLRCSGHSFWTEKHETSKVPTSYDSLRRNDWLSSSRSPKPHSTFSHHMGSSKEEQIPNLSHLNEISCLKIVSPTLIELFPLLF